MRYPTFTLAGMRRAVAVALLCAAPTLVWATTRGPDAAGYTGSDATVYSFVDISGPSGGASVLSGTDDSTAVLTLPFTFQFYGQPYTLACVSSNGAIYFVPGAAQCGGLIDFNNIDLATTASPGDFPAAFPWWSDLSFQVAGAGSVFYQTVGTAGSRRFIVQWDRAYPASSTNPVTFQAILFEGSNRILFQYKTADLGTGNGASGGGTATIGVRDAAGQTSSRQIEWSFNSAVILNESALMFDGGGVTVPQLTWANPADIVYGTALGATQLNAASDVPGTFAYTPPAGTVLPAGAGQTLSVLFTPSDPVHYTTATANATINVTQAPSTTTLYALPPTVGALQPLFLIAVVSSPAGTPAGTVQFRDGATVIGNGTVTNGVGALIVNGLASGAHSLTAAFSAGGNFANSTSAPANVTVQSTAMSTFTFALQWTNPAAQGQPVLLSALVRPLAGTVTPTGSVQFREGGTVLGAAPLVNGLATVSLSGLSAGTHTIIAQYLGAGTFAGSLSPPVVQTIYNGARPQASAITLVTSPSPSVFGQPVTFTATITPTSAAPTGTVYFYADDVPIGSGAVTLVGGAYKATLTTGALSRGAHVINAVYLGNATVSSSTSLPAVQVVQ